MALDPIELLVVGAVVVVIFLWGPGKIPEMARSLGRAKKEFDSAQKEFQEVTKQFQAESGLTGLAKAASSTSSASLIDRLTALAGEPASAAPSSVPQLPQPTTQVVQPATVAPPAAASDSKSADQVLIETAKQLEIATEGKTREQISEEILAKAKAGTSGFSSSAPT